MTRFGEHSTFQGCLELILRVAKNAEDKLASFEYLEPGTVLGLDFYCSLPLVEGVPWSISGQVQCADSRYVDFSISGDDSFRQNSIASFSISVFNAAVVPEHDHSAFLDDSSNAELTWEYISREFTNRESRPGIHLHRRGGHSPQVTSESAPEQMSVREFERIFDESMRSVKNPEEYWQTFVIIGESNIAESAKS